MPVIDGYLLTKLAQLEREIATLVTRTHRFVAEVNEKIKEVTTAEEEDKIQVREASHLAYGDLQKIVERLLEIDNDSKKLSRQDRAICASLDGVVRRFRVLSDISRENFMALGDQAATFVEDLQSYVDSVNTDVPFIWSAMNATKMVLQQKQDREEELCSQEQSAQNSRDVSTHLLDRTCPNSPR
jgi:multidrug efflux pump subunit AcrA (membrane-fusion protein)